MIMDGHVENYDAYKVETIGNTCVVAVDVVDYYVTDVVKKKILIPRAVLSPHHNYININIRNTCVFKRSFIDLEV